MDLEDLVDSIGFYNSIYVLYRFDGFYRCLVLTYHHRNPTNLATTKHPTLTT